MSCDKCHDGFVKKEFAVNRSPFMSYQYITDPGFCDCEEGIAKYQEKYSWSLERKSGLVVAALFIAALILVQVIIAIL